MRSHLVTGANSGLGFEVTKALASRGDRVVMAVRDAKRGDAARDSILRAHPAARLELASLDLLDLRSVRALAERDLRLDTLILNAGIGTTPKELSPEGILVPLAANHFGHFALAGLLFPQLEAGVLTRTGVAASDADGSVSRSTQLPRDGARIVTVSSGFAKRGKLDFDNFDGGRGYWQGAVYAQSKLANVLFAIELDRRLGASGSKAKSVLAHPGVAATEMQQKPTGLMGVISRAVSRFVARPADVGARPIVEAAIGETVQSGEMWGPGKRASDPARREEPWSTMRDHADAAKLWDRSEAITGVRFLSS